MISSPAWLRRPPGYLALALWMMGSIGARTASAEPRVRVRAESRIEIGVEYEGDHLAIRGALRDELGGPLGDATVSVLLREPGGESGEQRQLVTDAQGRFTLQQQGPPDSVILQAGYFGDLHHRGVRVERRIDRNRADVRLELVLPEGGRLDLDAEAVAVRVLAESDTGGQALPMTLRDESSRILATGETDSLGRLAWLLPTARLGPPGSGLLRLESAGDATRGEAQTEARAVRFRRLELELHGSDLAEAGTATLLSGTVRSKVGPKAAQPVGIFVGEEHITTSITNEDGSFETELWPSHEGEIEVVARVERDPAGAYPAAQAVLRLSVGPAGSVPWPWLFLGLLPAAAAWLISRRRPLLNASLEETQPTSTAGVVPAKGTLRRAIESQISGTLQHSRTGFPIAGAQLWAHQGEESVLLGATDSDGHFDAGAPAGRHDLEVKARGFTPLHVKLQIPHRGEWSSCLIRLDSQRDLALAPYRDLVVPRLPSPLSWNLWTPREIARALQGRWGAAIGTLSETVEQASYAEEPPDPERLESIARQSAAIAKGMRPEVDEKPGDSAEP